jgi:hypothetical protein
MGYLQTIRLRKETDSKSPVGVDSGKAVHVEDGDLSKGNDDRWGDSIRRRIKRDQIDNGHVPKDKTTGGGIQ